MFQAYIVNDTEVFFNICISTRGASVGSGSVELNNGTKYPDPLVHKWFGSRNLNIEINNFAPICYIMCIGPIGI
jgi:hypothetical protein